MQVRQYLLPSGFLLIEPLDEIALNYEIISYVVVQSNLNLRDYSLLVLFTN